VKASRRVAYAPAPKTGGMRVAVAGTFGPLHDGHRALLETALEFGECVVVGLTTDAFARSSRARTVPPYEEREAAVRAAIEASDQECGVGIEIRPIDSEHGFAATDSGLDALVVSPETVAELPDVNDERRERGLEPLLGVVVPYVLAGDGERISSTRIARGEIDDSGTVR